MDEIITKQSAIAALKALGTIDYAADAIYLEDAIEAISALPRHKDVIETDAGFLERMRAKSDRIFDEITKAKAT